MIDWATVGPVIVTWVKYGTGLEQVILENEERPFVLEQWGRIALAEEKVVGTDMIRFFPIVGEDNKLAQKILGYRVVTFDVAVEALNQSFADFAAGPISRLMSFAQLPVQHERLKAVDAGLLDVGESSRADYEDDQRLVSAYVLKVRFNVAFTADPNDPPNTWSSWIESVQYTPNIKTATGAIYPNPLVEETIDIHPESPVP